MMLPVSSTFDEERAGLIAGAAGFLWLAAAAILGLLAGHGSRARGRSGRPPVLGPEPVSAWAVTAAILGYWLPASVEARRHRIAGTVRLVSPLAAAAPGVCTSGSALMWGVVMLRGGATGVQPSSTVSPCIR